MIKNIFLDRDGIINDVIFREGTVSSPHKVDEFKISDDFVSFYDRLSVYKLDIFVVSNQPDVARKLISTQDLALMTLELRKRFDFKEIIYCTHDNRDKCACRKPLPGMINDTINKYVLKKHECIIIGDSFKDVLAGHAAGISTVFLKRYYNSFENCFPDHVIDNLNDFFDLGILQ